MNYINLSVTISSNATTTASSITKQLITIRGLSTRLWVTDDVTTGTRLVSLINIPPKKNHISVIFVLSIQQEECRFNNCNLTVYK